MKLRRAQTGVGLPIPREMGHWLLAYPRAVPMAAFALIAALTGLGVLALEQGERERRVARLSEEAQAIAALIEQRADTAAAHLKVGAALLQAQGDPPRAPFSGFADSLGQQASSLGTEGFGWAQAVRPAAVDRFEAAMIASGAAGFKVTPPPPGTARHAVVVMAFHPSTAHSGGSIGFDMYSHPVSRAAMDQAERSEQPTATGRIGLGPQPGRDEPGFLIYLPVFTSSAGERTLAGFIYSPIRAKAFLASVLNLLPDHGHRIRVYDGAPNRADLLADMGGEAGSGLAVRQEITLANHPMVLEIEAATSEMLSPLAGIVLISGLLMACLLAIVLHMRARQAIVHQQVQAWQEEQDAVRQSLTRELNHRVKNTLANVLSIIALTRRRATSLDQFADGLDGRVQAMSATHDLLTRSEWGSTPLRDVVEAEMALYLALEDRRVEIGGPPVELAPGDALSFGLAVHELTTNAAQHGALGSPRGSVSVTWAQVKPDLVRVVWHEQGGPDARAAPQHGFGLQLIERIVAHELGQPVEIEFAEGGVTCILLVPVRPPSDFALRARHRH